MNCSASLSSSPSQLLLNAVMTIPISQYLLAFFLCLLVFLYNFLEIHFLQDFVRGFRGDRVSLTYHPASDVYHRVVALCRTLRGRYLPTLWLSSPHLQTVFLSIFGRPPVFDYRRQVFCVPDGGTIALDWLVFPDDGTISRGSSVQKQDTTPIVIVIPGLTSDSSASYIKHLVFKIAKRGWKAVVCNHRGLGGMSITSDRFYNAGWTEDLRRVVSYMHQEYPDAPLFTVGTSIGANILVKYLGEEGENTPVAGSASICSPWDLVICDRFINRKLVQKIYDRMLTIGLQGYAKLHQPLFSQLANWEGIEKSRSIRDFDNYATRLVGKFETVDTYYRHCSSASFVANVSVPLLCICALDDPLCTMEAIPWDECRANKNVVLATAPHGGHLAFFEGLEATSLWWVRAVEEFLTTLHGSSLMHKQKKTHNPGLHSSLDSTIDKGPYLDVTEDGMVAAAGNDQTTNQFMEDLAESQIIKRAQDRSKNLIEDNPDTLGQTSQSSGAAAQAVPVTDNHVENIGVPVRKYLNQLSQHSRRSLWLLVYIAIVTSWPLVGSALLTSLKKRLNVLYKRRS